MNYCLLANAGFDTAENEPSKVCPLSVYRSPRYEPYAKAGRTAQPPKEKGPAEEKGPAFTAPEGEIEAVDRSFKGVVKTKCKSYGFIESPDSVAIYGRDIFFSTKKISTMKKIRLGLEVGSTVEVNVQLHDGQPRVTRVLEINGEPI